MNIKTVIHKNWLPMAANFQTGSFSPVGVQLVFSACALMGRKPPGTSSGDTRLLQSLLLRPPAAPAELARSPQWTLCFLHIIASHTGKWQSYHYTLPRKWRADFIKLRWEDSFKSWSPHQEEKRTVLSLNAAKTTYNLNFMFLLFIVIRASRFPDFKNILICSIDIIPRQQFDIWY